MERIILFALLFSQGLYAGDCFYAYTASCTVKDSDYIYNNINFVVSAEFDKNTKQCPANSMAAFAASNLLAERNTIGQFCPSNEDFLIYRMEHMPIAVGPFKKLDQAISTAKNHLQTCLDASHYERCFILNDFGPIQLPSEL